MINFREIRGAMITSLGAFAAQSRNIVLIICGFAIASSAIIFLLSIPVSLERISGKTGISDVVIIFDVQASGDEGSSTITQSEADIIATLPGIEKDDQGHPLVASQYITSIKIVDSTGNKITTLVRGVTPATWIIASPVVRSLSNFDMHTGTNELLVGSALASSYAIDAGSQLPIRNSPWRVLDRFTAQGGLWESEFWGDMSALQQAFNAQGRISVLWVKLAPGAGLEKFEKAFADDMRLRDLRFVSQHEYYKGQLGFLADFSLVAAYGISILFGIGAILAISNVLMISLRSRRSVLATMRALGYQISNLGIALILEILTIGLVTSVVIFAAMYFTLNGMILGASTGNHAISFTLTITLGIYAKLILYVLTLGLLAAIFPTYRVLNSAIVTSLRD